jgi:hypothetical protein
MGPSSSRDISEAGVRLSTSGEEVRLSVQSAAIHCRAALKALEASIRTLESTGSVYPVHLQVAAIEMAHAIELALQIVLAEGGD